LKEKWQLFNLQLSNFDGILLGSAVMIILLTATLALVPSVVKKVELIPRNGRM